MAKSKKPFKGTIFQDIRTTYGVVKSNLNGAQVQRTHLLTFEESQRSINSVELQKALSLPLMLKSGINPQEVNIKGLYDSRDICDNPNLVQSINQVASEIYLAENQPTPTDTTPSDPTSPDPSPSE